MNDAAPPLLLAGRVAVITGASRARGIGLATARLFAQHGARVALLDLDEGEAVVAAGALGPQHLGLGCDVRDAAACAAAVERVRQWGGRIDVLVNNAAITQKRGLLEVTADDFEQMVAIALRGTFRMSQCVIPTMVQQGSGSIISISSMSAQQGGGVFGGSHYCAAKAGVLGFTRALAKELGPDGIRANAVAPGLIITDFSRTNRSDADKDASAKDWPLARAGRAVELASACLFLASDLASFVTGTTLDVNGGAHMR